VGESRAWRRADSRGSAAVRQRGTAFAFATSTLQNNPEPQRAYPWGDDWDAEKANAAMNVGDQHARLLRTGRSPYGCGDLSGNVWEWTRSLWGTDWRQPAFVYPYDARDLKREDPDAPRTMSSGSCGAARGAFIETSPAAPSAAGFVPGTSGCRYFGFRVVLRSSPVP
jgi:formylglycine-generating enzyme required for sulfatase activity